MKKFILLIGMSFYSILFFGQPQLIFRLANPRDTFVGVSFLKYDVQVKASTGGTYAKSLQANFYYNSNVIGTTLVTDKAGISAYQLYFGGDAYSVISSIVSGLLNIYVTANTTTWFGSGDPLSWDFAQVTTSYQTLATVRIRIVSESAGSGRAGLFFSRGIMSTEEFYQDPSSSGGLLYSMINPSSYDTTKYLRNMYVGRIYSAIDGWTQAKSSPTIVDWTVTKNTSVWDTGTGGAAILSITGALATKLRIHNAARMKINPGGQLTCSDTTIIDEPRGLWIAAGTGSGGIGTADGSFIDNGTIIYNTGGTAKEERYLQQGTTSPSPPSGYGWHSLCIPVTTTTTAPFQGLYMKWYDEPYHKYRWVINPALDSVLSASMKGYFMWSNPATTGNATIGVTGSLNTGSKSIPLTRTNNDPGVTDYDGYNFVGNPYPSSTNWVSSGWSLTNVDQTMWFWRDSCNCWGVFNRTSIDSTLKVSRFIPPMQGFYVHVTSPLTSGTLAVSNAARLHKSVPYYKDGAGGYNDRLTLGVTGAGGGDEAVVRFDAASTVGYNTDFDAYKNYSTLEAPQLYSILLDADATLYVLPWTGINQVVPLGFSCGVSGDFTLTAGNISSFRTGIEIYLEDKQMPGNAWPDLRSNPVYQFSYTMGEDPRRFNLHFTNIYFGISDPTINAMQIYSYEDFVYIKNITGGNTQGDVFIYDLTGRKIFQDKLQNNPISKYRINANEGYYLVNVITPDNTYHQKVYLK